MQMKADQEIVAELSRMMRINEDIIRYLVVKVDEFENKENLISQAKTFGEDASMKDTGYRTVVKAADKGADVDSAVKDPVQNEGEAE